MVNHTGDSEKGDPVQHGSRTLMNLARERDSGFRSRLFAALRAHHSAAMANSNSIGLMRRLSKADTMRVREAEEVIKSIKAEVRAVKVNAIKRIQDK